MKKVLIGMIILGVLSVWWYFVYEKYLSIPQPTSQDSMSQIVNSSEPTSIVVDNIQESTGTVVTWEKISDQLPASNTWEEVKYIFTTGIVATGISNTGMGIITSGLVSSSPLPKSSSPQLFSCFGKQYIKPSDCRIRFYVTKDNKWSDVFLIKSSFMYFGTFTGKVGNWTPALDLIKGYVSVYDWDTLLKKTELRRMDKSDLKDEEIKAETNYSPTTPSEYQFFMWTYDPTVSASNDMVFSVEYEDETGTHLIWSIRYNKDAWILTKDEDVDGGIKQYKDITIYSPIHTLNLPAPENTLKIEVERKNANKSLTYPLKKFASFDKTFTTNLQLDYGNIASWKNDYTFIFYINNGTIAKATLTLNTYFKECVFGNTIVGYANMCIQSPDKKSILIGNIDDSNTDQPYLLKINNQWRSSTDISILTTTANWKSHLTIKNKYKQDNNNDDGSWNGIVDIYENWTKIVSDFPLLWVWCEWWWWCYIEKLANITYIPWLSLVSTSFWTFINSEGVPRSEPWYSYYDILQKKSLIHFTRPDNSIRYWDEFQDVAASLMYWDKIYYFFPYVTSRDIPGSEYTSEDWDHLYKEEQIYHGIVYQITNLKWIILKTWKLTVENQKAILSRSDMWYHVSSDKWPVPKIGSELQFDSRRFIFTVWDKKFNWNIDALESQIYNSDAE